MAAPVVSAHPQLATAPSVAPWLYVIWHTSFPLLLGVAWAPWPDRLTGTCPPAWRRLLAWASQGLCLALDAFLTKPIRLPDLELILAQLPVGRVILGG